MQPNLNGMIETILTYVFTFLLLGVCVAEGVVEVQVVLGDPFTVDFSSIGSCFRFLRFPSIPI
jgi:hypothetical protein